MSYSADFSAVADTIQETGFTELVSQASAEFHKTYDPETAILRFTQRLEKAKEHGLHK